jgi:DNA-binding NarL/FixJ family response regulator
LPGEDGLAAIPAFGQLRPEAPVIILSSSEDPADVRRALELGALGYVPKSAHAEALKTAIEMVLAGEVYTPQFGEAPTGGPLTPRQREVLAALAAGLSNKAIGRRFGLSDKTVKVHVGAILRALGVANRTQAAQAAHRLGIRPQS